MAQRRYVGVGMNKASSTVPGLVRVQDPLGSSGVNLVGNQVWQSDEYNVDLATPQKAVSTFDRMRKSDGQVRSSLNHILYTILSAQWRIDAQLDDPEGEEIAEFIASILMPGESTGYTGGVTLIDLLKQFLLAPVFGFSVSEKILGIRESDGMTVFAAIEARLPRSIVRFNLTKTGASRLESVTQLAQHRDGSFREVDMPVAMRVGTDKDDPGTGGLIVNSFNREGDNWWGESILRPAHYHWRVKRELINFDAIQKERMGGIFWVQSREGQIPTDDQVDNAQAVLENFRIHERQGLYFPSVFEFHALFPGGSGQNFTESIEYHDRQIERCLVAQWQSLGTGDKGALAVGNIQTDMMLMGYQFVAKSFEDVLLEYAIKDLVDINFGPRPYGLYPRASCENFLQMKPDRLAQVCEPLVSVGLIRVDKPIRVLFREKLSLPEEDEATLEPVPGQIPPGGDPNQPGRPNQPPGGGPPNDAPVAKRSYRLRKAAPAGLNRAPFPHEAHVDFHGMFGYIDKMADRAWLRSVDHIRNKQIEKIVTKAAALAVSPTEKLDTDALGTPLLRDMTSELAGHLVTVYKAGRASVLVDRNAQAGLAKRHMKKQPEYDQYGDEVDPDSEQRSFMADIAGVFAKGALLSLVLQAVKSALSARQAVMSRAEAETKIRDDLKALSEPSQQANLSAAITQAFTNGRVDQGADMADQIEAVYYSAIRDTSTCGPCWDMDGEEIDLDEVDALLPNPNCGDGFGMCRCQPVYVFKEQVMAAMAKLRTLRKFNPNHEPGGSETGGQFTSGDEGGGGGGSAGGVKGGAPKSENSYIDDVRRYVDDPETVEALAQAHAEADAIPRTNTINTPERMALRQSVIEESYGSGASVKEREAWLVSGLPASGKNVAVSDPLAAEHGALIIDNDLMKQKLPEYGNGIGAAAVHEEASGIIQPAVIARAVAARGQHRHAAGREDLRLHEGRHTDAEVRRVQGPSRLRRHPGQGGGTACRDQVQEDRTSRVRVLHPLRQRPS